MTPAYDTMEGLEAYLYTTCKLTMEDRHKLVAGAVRAVLPQCLTEARRHPENPDRGRECAYQAISIIDDLWPALKPGWHPEGYYGRIWVHTAELPDPRKFKDDHNIDKAGVERAAAAYLARPWLSSGYLDWVMLDALTRQEVVQFDLFVNGPKVDLTGMGTSKLLEWIIRGGVAIPVEAAILAGVAWFLWGQYSGSGYYRNVWASAAAAYYIWIAVRVRKQLKARRKILAEGAAAKATLAQLIGTMKMCYVELAGPVLNPTRIKERFQAAEALGTHWSAATWPLLDNAINRNRSIWITGRHNQSDA